MTARGGLTHFCRIFFEKILATFAWSLFKNMFLFTYETNFAHCLWILLIVGFYPLFPISHSKSFIMCKCKDLLLWTEGMSSTPPSIRWKPNSQCDSIWKWVLGEIIRLKWGHEGGAPRWVSSLIKNDTIFPSLLFLSPCKDIVRG